MNTIKDVQLFMQTFGQDVKSSPQLPSKQIAELRVSLLAEEVSELQEAFDTNDIVGVLDALTDIQYVLDGAYLACGLQALKQPAFDEVQASNMSKLGEDGLPIYREDGKIMKGPNYFKPDLEKIMREHQRFQVQEILGDQGAQG